MDDINLITPDQRPTRADAVKNRELLLQTARRLFAQTSVDCVTMTQIADEAGVGKGTLYRHFTNKNEICEALLDQEMRELQTNTLQRARTHHDGYENLRWFLAASATFVHENSDILFAGLEVSPLSFLQSPAHLWWRPTIRGFLQQIKAQYDNSLPDDLDYLTDVLYVLLDVGTIRFQQNQGYSLERIIDGLHLTMNRIIG